MNTYTKDLKVENVGSAERRISGGGKSYLARFAVGISILCLFVFCAAASRIHFTARIERMNKRAASVRTQLKEVNIQIYNLRSRREELTAWPNISEKIARYRLGLREADYRQLSCVPLVDPPKPRQKTLRPTAYAGSGKIRRTAREYARIGNH